MAGVDHLKEGSHRETTPVTFRYAVRSCFVVPNHISISARIPSSVVLIAPMQKSSNPASCEWRPCSTKTFLIPLSNNIHPLPNQLRSTKSKSEKTSTESSQLAVVDVTGISPTGEVRRGHPAVQSGGRLGAASRFS
jgi:hypothetical protein